MEKLLIAAVLISLAGAARSDGGAADKPAPAAPEGAKAGAAKSPAGNHAGQPKAKGKRAQGASKPPPGADGKAAAPKGAAPCEPVKPCPID